MTSKDRERLQALERAVKAAERAFDALGIGLGTHDHIVALVEFYAALEPPCRCGQPAAEHEHVGDGTRGGILPDFCPGYAPDTVANCSYCSRGTGQFCPSEPHADSKIACRRLCARDEDETDHDYATRLEIAARQARARVDAADLEEIDALEKARSQVALRHMEQETAAQEGSADEDMPVSIGVPKCPSCDGRGEIRDPLCPDRLCMTCGGSGKQR